ncbi:hypothetical protein ACFQ0T_28015 [Kitasatospora gansuensis]
MLDAILRVMPTDLKEAQDLVHRVGAVPDPSLPERPWPGCWCSWPSTPRTAT